MSEPPPPRPARAVRGRDGVVPRRAWPSRPGAETEVVVEQTETETVPPRRAPVIWPWLLALLVLVLAGLGAALLHHARRRRAGRDDHRHDRRRRRTVDGARSRAGRRRHDVVGGDRDAPRRRPRGQRRRGAVRPAGRQVVAQNPAAGSDAPEGSTVRLNVAQARRATTPPPTTTAPAATTAPTEPSRRPSRTSSATSSPTRRGRSATRG